MEYQEKYNNLMQKSWQNINLADHMLLATFPLLKDPKLLISVVENIFLSYANSITAFLTRERAMKRVPVFNENSFESKFRIFREKCAQNLKIDRTHLKDMVYVRDMLLEHKKSPIEFNRRGNFVICSKDYRMKSVSPEDLKKMMNRAKVFIGEIDKILKKDE